MQALEKGFWFYHFFFVGGWFLLMNWDTSFTKLTIFSDLKFTRVHLTYLLLDNYKNFQLKKIKKDKRK